VCDRDTWLEKVWKILGFPESLLFDIEHKLHELGAVELEDLLVLADSKEDLQELELGFTDQALSQFWEKVDEASQESEAWLQQQAADKTRQQQREEEERVIPEPAHDTCHMTRGILGTSRLVPSRCSTAADRCFRMFVRAQSRRPRTRLQRAAERRRVVVGVPGKLNACHPHDSCSGACVRPYCTVPCEISVLWPYPVGSPHHRWPPSCRTVY